MKKLYFLDEEEKNRILNIHEGATKRQYLNEAPDTPELKIAQQIVNATSKMSGTDPAGLVKAIQSIADATQFWKVNKLVKTLNGDKLDIVGQINNEFEYGDNDYYGNQKDLDKITAKLKTFGFRPTIQQGKSGTNTTSGTNTSVYIDGTYKINAQPTSTSTNIDWAACVKQFPGTMEASDDPTWVKIPIKSDKVNNSMWFKNNYSATYRPGGGSPDIKGSWACNSNKLTIKLDDNWTWDGKWIDPNKAAVVDPKVAYQQRAKQVTQQTQTTTKQIQTLLGQEPTGNLDAIYVDKVIDLLKQ